MDKMFTCQECDFDLEVPDVYNSDTVRCHNCGQEYRLRFIEREESWELIPIEPVEGSSTEAEDEPFQIDVEPGGLEQDEYDRY
ncbi:MAG: hypothetical protein IH614_02170 [Desulfuromonadales bacterium]|nr:hypothetical protein [Desulfuromonadales bacterium]